MDADRLLRLLGRQADDPLVESVLVELRTQRRPELDLEDRDAVRDWVLVRREGVEIGVIDQAYLEAAPASRRRRKGVPLIVCQIYFYTARDDIADFKGALPFGLRWQDSRAEARRKLRDHEDRRRSHTTDTWDVPGFRITVEYKSGGESIASVLCQILVKPWPEKGRKQPQLSTAAWIALLGEPQSSAVLRRQLRPLDLAAQLEGEDEPGELEFLKECGVQLYFTEAKNLKRVKMAARAKRTDLVFGAVEFFRRRAEDAREWTGELPARLTFDDTPETMIFKVGREPDERTDERFTGIARWHRPEGSLEVIYNNIENHLVRISLMAPGFRSQI
jgi:hypothetical protein